MIPPPKKMVHKCRCWEHVSHPALPCPVLVCHFSLPGSKWRSGNAASGGGSARRQETISCEDCVGAQPGRSHAMSSACHVIIAIATAIAGLALPGLALGKARIPGVPFIAAAGARSSCLDIHQLAKAGAPVSRVHLRTSMDGPGLNS